MSITACKFRWILNMITSYTVHLLSLEGSIGTDKELLKYNFILSFWHNSYNCIHIFFSVHSEVASSSRYINRCDTGKENIN